MLKKPDEMEMYQNMKSSRPTLIFYSLSLLIWSLYDFIKHGKLSIAFGILIIGNAIFWWGRFYYNRKMK